MNDGDHQWLTVESDQDPMFTATSTDLNATIIRRNPRLPYIAVVHTMHGPVSAPFDDPDQAADWCLTMHDTDRRERDATDLRTAARGMADALDRMERLAGDLHAPELAAASIRLTDAFELTMLLLTGGMWWWTDIGHNPLTITAGDGSVHHSWAGYLRAGLDHTLIIGEGTW